MKHDFPGNVRELENMVEHAFVLCDDELIHPRHLPESLWSKKGKDLAFPESLQENEAAYIREVLRRNNWDRTAAAAELGIHKSTLYRKVKSLNLILPEKDGRSNRKG